MSMMKFPIRAAAVSLAIFAASTGFVTADSPPAVTNAPAIPAIGSATLGGVLTAGDSADISIYWGRSDGGTNATAWDSAVMLPGVTNGPFSSEVAAGYGVTYYFRCYATNAASNAWAAATDSFTTLEPVAGNVLTAAGQTFEAYFEDHDGQSWLLIGRGRQGWEFDTDGQGNVDDVSRNVGTPAAFTPACYSNAIVNDLMGQAGLTMSTLEMRLSRASDVDGTVEYQDVRWRDFGTHGTAGSAFTWDIENNDANRYNGITMEFKNAPAGLPGAAIATFTGGNTRDFIPHNDARRVFTWAWNGHASQKGFSYGTSVNAGINDPNAFLWENGTENHSIPYTEVYIPYDAPPSVAFAITNTAVSDVLETTATVNGSLMATGWVFEVTVYWGATDGEDVPGNWDNEMSLGSYTNYEGDLSHAVTGLTASSSYFYTFGVSNAVTNGWASPSRYFGTLGTPVVSNSAATDITQTSATLNGELVSGGTGEATIYWGLTDGGTAPGAWDHTNDVGAVIDTFSTTASLLAGGTYYYRCYVTNAIDDDWSDLAETFTSAVPEVSLDLTINIPDLGLDPTTPTSSVPGCVLWLAGDDIDGDGDTGNNPTNGASINVWSDKSGLGHDVSRTGQVDPSLNANGPNGRPVVAFDADRDYMSSTYNFDAHREYTVLSVARYTGGASARVISSASRNWLFGFHGNGVRKFHPQGWVFNGTGSDTDWHIHAGHVNDDPDPQGSFWIDGGLLIADDNGSGNGNHMIGQLGLGGYRDNNEESDCEIAEVLIYDRVLTPGELSTVGLYLDNKYGLNTAYAPVTETRGTITATATLSAPSVSNVTVNFAFAGSNPSGLLHKGFNDQNNDNYLDLNDNGGLMALSPYGTAVLTDGPGGRGLDFDSDADFTDAGVIGQNDYYANLFIGYFHPPVDGAYLFRNAGDDDRGGIWLDLDQDGVFESSTPGLGSNRGEQLSWEDGGAKEVELTGGERYMVAFTHREGTGGSRCDFRFRILYGPEMIIKPSDPAQAGLWSYVEAPGTYGSDYSASALSIEIPAGSISSNITITPIDDTEQEEDETSQVSIDSVVNAVIGSPDDGVFVISSDDPMVVNGRASNVADGTATIGGTLSMGDDASVKVHWGLTDGDTDPSQWDATSTVGYAAEDMPFSVDLTGLVAEQTYYYRCYATNDSNLGEDWADATASFMTEGPSVSIDDITVVEGNSGSTAAVFTVSLSAPSTAGVTADYATLDGSATVADGDYTAANGTVSIPAGQVSTQVTVMVTGDRRPEGISETFAIELSNAMGASLGDASGACVIEDDDLDVYLSGFAHRMPITFNGYTGSETLTNWPALLRVSEANIPGFSYASLASATGGDVRFTSADGTKLLNFEIEVWNPAGESAVWVQVPELASTNTRIWAYWGNPNETALPTYATDGSTWSEGYRLVQHMADVSGTTVADSSPDRRSSAIFGTGTWGATGNIASALQFTGNDNDRIELTAAGFVDLSGGEWSGSAWFQNLNGNSHDTLFRANAGNNHQVIIWSGSNDLGCYDGGFRDSGGDLDRGATGWHHIMAVGVGTVTKFYIDGVHVADAPTKSVSDIRSIGGHWGGGQKWSEYLDEVRIADVARSADWILASYANQAAGSTFITPGSIESKPTLNVANGATNIMTSSAYVTATLTSTGTAETAVWLHWGETDGGRTPTSWANTQPMGTVTQAPPVAYTTNLVDLTGGSMYYYAYSASNSEGVTWASTQFFTLGAPFVENTPATPAVGYATLNGNLLSTGGAPTTVFTYWGDTDGGTNAGAWGNAITNGVLPAGAFSADTTADLIYGRAYYYRSMATNANGAAWAASSTGFMTDREMFPLAVPVTNGLDLWLDGSDLDGGGDEATGDPSVGANITAWVDKSGEAPSRDATDLQSDPAVADGPNGSRVVRFDTDDRMATTHSFITPEYTIFGVSRYAGAARNRVLSSRDTNWLFGHHGGMDETFYANGWVHNTGNNNTDWHIYTAHINSEVDPKASFWKDGTLLTSNNAGSHNSNYKPQKLQLNGYNGNTQLSDSEIAEVIIYSRVLTSTEIEEVGAYLEYKYALGTVYDPDLYTPPSPFSLANELPSDVTTTSATLNATLSIPSADYDVWVRWGETDGGGDIGQWASSAFVGSFTDTTTSVSHAVANGLVPGGAYYYTFHMTNAVHEMWAKPSARLEMPGLPVISDGRVTAVAAPTAILGGRFLTHTRGDVTLCWGLTDGGTNSVNDWDHSISIGTQTEADFSGVVTPVYYGQTYAFRCYATNAYGDDWSETATMFSVDLAPPGIPLEGLLGMWTFDDGTSKDVSGNGRHGMDNGAVYGGDVAPGGSGQSIDLNGDKYVLVDTGGNQDVFDVDTITVSCWVKEWPDHNGEPYVSKRGESSQGWQLRRYSNSGTDVCLTLRGPSGNNDLPNAPTTVNADGLWHHLVGTYDGSMSRVYVNNVQIAALAKSGPIADTGSLLVFGARDNSGGGVPNIGNMSNTKLDDVVIYDRALTAGEIGELYARHTAVPIINDPPTDMTLSSMQANATVSLAGGVYDLWVYWGPTDGADSSAAWATNAFLGTVTGQVGSVSHVASIAAGTTNYYAFRATNIYADIWGTPSMVVDPVAAPAINNDAGAVADVGSATLQGELTAGGYADISVYWGRSDGDTNATAWDSVVALADTPEGAFDTDVAAGYGVTYYYRCYATNASGDAWASATASFTTLEPPPPEQVPVTNGLIAEYKFEDNAEDTSGNNAHAALVGAASYIDGRVGRGIKLNASGSGDFVDIPALNGGAESQGITYGMWVKLNAAGANMDVLMNHDGWSAGLIHFSLADNTGLVRSDLNTQGNKTAGTAHKLSQTEWRYMFYVNNNIEHTVDYWMDSDLDGVLNNNGRWVAQADRTVVNNVGRQIGAWNNGRWLKADVDEVVIFNRGITQAEAQEVYDFYLNPPLPLGITNSPVSNVSTGSVTMNGMLSADGWTFDIYACWGTNDAGTVTGNWDSCVMIGSVTNHTGPIGYNVTGLSLGPDYYGTFVAINTVTNIGAAPSTGPFQVLSAPTVENLAATDVTRNSATFNGDLVQGGSADITVYWGLSDGGTNSGNWDDELALGTLLPEPFSRTASVLAGGQYYYRCYATNALGYDWADTTETFQSTPAGFVIADASLTEGDTGQSNMVFSVTLSDVSASNVTVSFATGNGSATAGVDYTGTNGMLSITSGQVAASVAVPITGDREGEYPSEDFQVELSGPVNAVLDDGTAIGTIVDDDFDRSLSAWKAKMKITFDGYTGTNTLTNFPALVVFNESIPEFLYDDFASPTGADLRFADALEQQELNYETEKWDPAGSSYTWVQVPELVDSSTYIWAYWGNSRATNTPAYTTNGATWSEGFGGVWHMDAVDPEDATANDNDGAGSNTPTLADGVAGDGLALQDLSATAGDEDDIRVDDDDSIDPLSFTASTWIHTSMAGGWYRNIMGSFGAGGGQNGGTFWGLGWMAANNLGFVVRVGGGGNTTQIGGGALNDGAWHQLVGVRSGSDVKLYVDGALANTGTRAGDQRNSEQLWFGNHGGFGSGINGTIDESRVSTVVRSDDWIMASYSNQVPGSAFAEYSQVKVVRGTLLILR